MTAHILMLLVTFLDPIVPAPKTVVPQRPTDEQIYAEAQKRANHFCTPEWLYPDGATPLIVQCEKPLPDCDSEVWSGDPYPARCQGKI